MDEERALRVRAVIGRWFWAIAIVLAIGLAISGWVVYSTYVTPGTHTEERVESSWSTYGTFAHEARVIEDNPVFDTGTVLEDRPVYYRSVAPIVEGRYAFSYGSAVSGEATVETTVVLQIRSVSEEGETVHWEKNTQLAHDEETGVEPGQRVRTAFELNTSAVAQRLDEIESTLGQSPGSIQTRIVAWSTLEGTVAGEQVQKRELFAIPIAFSDGTYSFEDSGPWERSYETTRQVQVPNSQGPLERFGAPLLGLLSLAGLAALAVLQSRGLTELDTSERAILTYHRNRSAYDEWITRAKLPTDARSAQEANVATLEGLVDLAIDTDERVIEDPAQNRYFVRHGDMLYIYAPPIPIDDG